jgi:hypothetical protein
MSDLEKAKELVLELSAEERKRFRAWYADFDGDEWDVQLEADAASGKLDELAREAVANYKVGRATKAKMNTDRTIVTSHQTTAPDGRNIDDIADKAEKLYAEMIRPEVEPQLIGKIVAIDVDSGDYEVDGYTLPASRRLKARRPKGCFYSKRIGYDAVYAFGGATLRRTSK